MQAYKWIDIHITDTWHSITVYFKKATNIMQYKSLHMHFPLMYMYNLELSWNLLILHAKSIFLKINWATKILLIYMHIFSCIIMISRNKSICQWKYSSFLPCKLGTSQLKELTVRLLRLYVVTKKTTTFIYQVAFISKSYMHLGSVILVFKWILWAQTPKFSVPLEDHSRIFFL